MNIVIPMAGRGTRFEEAGFTVPKPLIDVNGEPMIAKAVKSLGIYGDWHFLIRKDENSAKIKSSLSWIVPSAKFIEIDYITDGPAVSVLKFQDQINNDRELIVANCDQIMWWNPGVFLRAAQYWPYSGMVVTYYSNTPKNSYAKLDPSGFVTEIKEKEIISNCSLNGIHYWKRGKFFVESALEMIAANDRAPNGEFYVGPTYNYLIKSGHRIGVHHIPNEQHHAVGTPEDLEKYIKLEKEVNGSS